MRYFRRAMIGWMMLCGTVALADEISPVTLDPITHQRASLRLDNGTQQVTLSPAEREELETYRISTSTPWRAIAADFDGVLLRDVLALNDMQDLDAIRVLAENDYAVEIPNWVWRTHLVLIATRVDGAPHKRRERGPLQFVMLHDAYTNDPAMSEGYWVWMAAAIEPVE